MKMFVLGLLAMSTCLNVFDFTSAQPTKKPCGYGTAEYVLMIGIDGLGGHYIRNATDPYPVIKSFFDEGSYTTDARAHNPTLSGSNWGAIVTGMRPEETGINNNYWKPANGIEDEALSQNYVEPVSGPGVPETVFKAARKQNTDLKTSMAVSWDWIGNLFTEAHVDQLYLGHYGLRSNTTNLTAPTMCEIENITGLDCASRADELILNYTVGNIKSLRSNLMFVHLDQVDIAGHGTYWGSEKYYDAVDVIDNYLGKIMTTLKETMTPSGEPMIDKTLVMITADHGGYNRSHSFCYTLTKDDTNSSICGSYNTPAVTKIPVLLKGPGIKTKFNMKETFLTNRDLAPTALNALGLNNGEYMTGRVIEEAYETAYCAAENGAKMQKPRQISVLIAILCYFFWM